MKICPYCQGTDQEQISLKLRNNQIEQIISCENCGKEWKVVHKPNKLYIKNRNNKWIKLKS